jgi:CheY-like chemotaxis protein
LDNKRGGRGIIMPVQSLMMFDEGIDWGIRCRYVSEWFKMDSYVSSKEGLLAEIERNMPDVVLLDLDLYARIDGIETSRRIRNRFDVPVVYV